MHKIQLIHPLKKINIKVVMVSIAGLVLIKFNKLQSVKVLE